MLEKNCNTELLAIETTSRLGSLGQDFISLLCDDFKQLWPSDLGDAKLEMQIKMRTLMLVLVGVVVAFLFMIPLF